MISRVLKRKLALVKDKGGSKNISDQIDNEDILDGAYKNPEEAEQKEEQENKEEDNGIEMSDNFESNLQDIKKRMHKRKKRLTKMTWMMKLGT